MIIKHAYIEKFRALNNIDFDLGNKITAIVGHNGTLKTTVLGILSQTFTIGPDNPMYGEKTIDGYNFRSQFSEKFKLSDKDIPGEHKWKLTLKDGIYKNNTFEAHSIPRNKNGTAIRFWSTEGKGSNTGYPQVPVYYISLKRVTPIGEENKINYTSELNSEEKKFIVDEYRHILTITEHDEMSVDTITSRNKYSAAIHSEEYDALAISAGQDNIAKLLLAVLSFKRLKDKFKSKYKGGILLIDEIESTLHPLAQSMLIKRIMKYARDYKIQFIFTTHSPTVIKTVFFDKYNKEDIKLLYLKRVGKTVIGVNEPPIENVIAELSGEVLRPKKTSVKKIDIFCEDIVARNIIRVLLSDYKAYYKISNCSIGAEEYIELLRVKLPSIINSVVILDGDKNTKSINNKIKNNNIKNVHFIPTIDCPEKMIYLYLFNLDPHHDFWDNNLGGFDKTKCFAEYNNLISQNANTDKYKKWFENVKSCFGKNYVKVLKYWMIDNKEEYEEFVASFISKYNEVAIRINGNPIELS